ncbi:MAG: class D sortase [Clostridiaceae bacterium]|nr:class D sortase [Clostridiaceae bacterium]
MSIFNREKPIENPIKERKPKKPIIWFLDILVIIIAVVGIYLIVKPMYVHWQQDRLSSKLQENFDDGDGTITFQADQWVVPGEDLEYFEDNDGYDIPPAESDIAEPEPEPEVITVKAIGKIKIDKIGVDMPVAEGSTKYNLRVAIGHYSYSASPGEPGLSIYLGHRMYDYGRHFNRLGEVVTGDIVVIETKEARFTYEVDRISIIDPQELPAYFNEQTDGENRLLLVTCHPVRVASHRLLVHGKLISTEPLA